MRTRVHSQSTEGRREKSTQSKMASFPPSPSPPPPQLKSPGTRRSILECCGKIYPVIGNFLFQKCDPTSLAIFRILFGFCMMLDVPQERGLEEADLRFGDPKYCFFPLFPGIQPLTLSQACIVYSVMWIGSLGIMLGLKFRLSCFLFLFPYSYFLLLDKSRWNNHSYLFGLIVILLSGSHAGHAMSLDNYFERRESVKVPKWNYFMLKFQLFILYFFAAVKKFDSDWIHGYSMKNLSNHWIFDHMNDAFRVNMIHLGGLSYDLTVGFMLNISCVKQFAFILSFLFHGLNSQVFTIGMFPYVCLASLVLFCEPHEFPCNLFSSSTNKLEKSITESVSSPSISKTQKQCIEKSEKKKIQRASTKKREKITEKETVQRTETRWWKIVLMLIYILIQLCLPFTHSITKGYNNWTPGLYGYSWNMMVYSWNTLHIKITVVDTATGTERFLDPDVWVLNDRWSSHGDMAKQYSQCIKKNLAAVNDSKDIAVHFDVWKSLNGRSQQRVFDPRVDILKAPWSPWEPVTWVLPLLDEYSDWREDQFDSITKNVANWTSSSNVIFVADFPDLYLENYMPPELSNVSVTVLKGQIAVEQQSRGKKFNITLLPDSSSSSLQISSGVFHRIYTIGPTPSCYMYTYTNATADTQDAKMVSQNSTIPEIEINKPTSYEIITEFVNEKIEVFSRSVYLIFNAYMNVLFDVPMVLRRAKY